LLAALPEQSERTHGGKHFPVRSRFVFAYETALRPATLDLLRWEDVTVAGLHIRAEVDKNRWQRVVPLSERARAALSAIGSGKAGQLIFGRHDYRTAFGAAAKAALGEARGATVSPYDLKHARVTAWLDEGDRVHFSRTRDFAVPGSRDRAASLTSSPECHHIVGRVTAAQTGENDVG
jgi:integrase